MPSKELTSHFSEANIFCHLWSLLSAGKVYKMVPKMWYSRKFHYLSRHFFGTFAALQATFQGQCILFCAKCTLLFFCLCLCSQNKNCTTASHRKFSFSACVELNCSCRHAFYISFQMAIAYLMFAHR